MKEKFPFFLVVFAAIQEFQKYGVPFVRSDLLYEAVTKGAEEIYKQDHTLVDFGPQRLEDQIAGIVESFSVTSRQVDARHVGQGNWRPGYGFFEHTNLDLQRGLIDLSHPIFDLVRAQVQPLLAKEAQLRDDFLRETREGERRLEDKYKRLGEEAGFH